MIETDAPYMRPDKSYLNEQVFKIMKKNKEGCNEPASLPTTCRVLADILELSPEVVAARTTKTAVNFFKLKDVDRNIDMLTKNGQGKCNDLIMMTKVMA